MAPPPGNSWALKLTACFIRCCGFWAEETKAKKRIMDIMMVYTITVVVLALGITTTDLYNCFGDFNKFAYCSLNVATVAFGLFKILAFSIKRKAFFALIYYAKEHFWYSNYDNYGAEIMEQCMTRCIRIIIFGALMSHLTVIFYTIKPFMVNHGSNNTERVLPFTIWLDLPVTTTPWYESLYIIETFSAYQCCVTYFCFDNFLCQINITLVGQFMILQRNFRGIYDNHSALLFKDDHCIRTRFVKCIVKHQQLIAFTDDLKEIYKNVILGVVVILSLLLCLVLYQFMMAGGEILDRMHYLIYGGGGITQLYFFALTSNDLTEASLAISDAAYEIRWFLIKSPMKKNELVKDLQMVIMRSQKASSLTIGGFAPVTLQTFTSICNRAFSFLTLMRQSTDM